VACSVRAAKSPVEKANTEDTVFQVHGQRQHSLDLRNRRDPRLVALGVVSGKEVERQTWVESRGLGLGS